MARKPPVVLTDDQVVAIRTAIAAGECDQRALAAQYEVSYSHLCNLVRGALGVEAGGPITRRTGPQSNTGYWGVTANSVGSRFVATMRENGRQRTLGTFRDAVDAARCYDAKAKALGYPPEKLNFPDE